MRSSGVWPVFTKENGHHLPPPALLLLQACCRGYAAGAMPQGLCGYAVWGYAAGAMLQESWIMADDDDDDVADAGS